MALTTFEVLKGIKIDATTEILNGSGAPGGNSETDNAVVGSLYLDEAGGLFLKETAGAGADKWQKQASEAYVDNATGSTLSWREPVVAHDDATTSIASAPTTVDGVTINSGDRVLFSAISAGDGKNVYIYGGGGVGDYAEDINNETSGDTVYVQNGTTYAGHRFTYNGTNWVRTDQSSIDEDGFIRTFIGKNAAGSESPSYSSATIVTQGGNLEAAVGELDAQVNTNVSDIDALEAQGLTTTASNVTTQTTVDTVTAVAVEWFLYCKENAGTDVNTFKVTATHDGTNVDSTSFSVLRPGLAVIVGLDVDVTLNGSSLELKVSSTTAVDVKAKRVSFIT